MTHVPATTLPNVIPFNKNKLQPTFHGLKIASKTAANNPRSQLRNQLRIQSTQQAVKMNEKKWDIQNVSFQTHQKIETVVNKIISLTETLTRLAHENSIRKQMIEEEERERKRELLLEQFRALGADAGASRSPLLKFHSHSLTHNSSLTVYKFNHPTQHEVQTNDFFLYNLIPL